MAVPRVRELAKNLSLLLALVALPILVANHSEEMQKGTDFHEFYAAARMVLAGRGHDLYKAAAQDEFQAHYFSGVGTYFNHPPFEILLYAPFALCSPRYAHWLWYLLNVGLLFGVAKLLARHVLHGYDSRVVLCIFLLFVPLLLNLLQGQDAALLLLVLTSTFVALKNRQEFAAGCLLACGLFKPHVVLPVSIALLPGAGKRFLTGFASVAIILAFLSAGICGWNVFTAYPRFVWASQQLPLAGFHPEQMANLRGLILRLFPARTPIDCGLTLAASLLVLSLANGWITAKSRKKLSLDLGFASVVIAGMLVSYHLSPHDLTILLLPVTLVFSHIRTTPAIPTGLYLAFIGSLVVIFFPPLDLFLLRDQTYAYASVPVLILFWLIHIEIRRCTAVGSMNVIPVSGR
jgi:Glycosyltransferase family 87